VFFFLIDGLRHSFLFFLSPSSITSLPLFIYIYIFIGFILLFVFRNNWGWGGFTTIGGETIVNSGINIMRINYQTNDLISCNTVTSSISWTATSFTGNSLFLTPSRFLSHSLSDSLSLSRYHSLSCLTLSHSLFSGMRMR
jgi:hypothetical protein